MYTVLNLGCATTVSARAINIDFNRVLELKASAIGRVVEKLTGRDWSLARQIRYHDLRKGIPYASGTVDAVYHSHVLEHLDHGDVPGFFAEIRRVLKPGGVHRVVVPDPEPYLRALVADLDRYDADGTRSEAHDAHVGGVLEQSVRRVPGGLRDAGPRRRKIEMTLFGDARKRGQTHQWMWTRVNLPSALLAAGFEAPRVVDKDTSAIPDWGGYGLDTGPDGRDLHDDSLYVEARAAG